MADEYIRREDAIDALDKRFDSISMEQTTEILLLRKDLRGLSAADVVPVVRCKDCKMNPHWEWVGCPMTGKNTRKPDDFCSYGERREE